MAGKRAAQRSSFSGRLKQAGKAFLREVTGLEPLAQYGGGGAAWQGASFDRLLSDFVGSIMSPDDEVKMSSRALRARARNLDRNHGLAEQFCEILCDNVIGPKGFQMDAQNRNAAGKLDKESNQKIEDAWRRWSKSRVSLDGKHNLLNFQKLALRTLAVDGEVFIRLHRGWGDWGLLLELVDCDLVDEVLDRRRTGDSNEIRMGIEVDRQGRAVAYHVLKNSTSTYMGVGNREHERIPAEDIIHVFKPKRPNQSRGVTWFATVLRTLWMEGEYMYTELVSSRVASSKGVVYERKDDDGSGVDPEEEQDQPDANGVNQNSGTGFREELEPGVGWALKPGWTAKLLDPNHPIGAFVDFMKTIGRRIATGFHVSYHVLTGDLEGVSFSSIRTGELAARDHWMSLHGFWQDQFFYPLHPEWLNSALLTGQLKLASYDFTKYLELEQIARGWDWVDPEADVNAAIKGIAWGITSRKRVNAAQGVDRDRIFEELEEEELAAAEKNIPIRGAIPGGGTDGQGAGSGAADGGASGGKVSAGRGRASGLGGHPRFTFPDEERELVGAGGKTNGNGHRN